MYKLILSIIIVIISIVIIFIINKFYNNKQVMPYDENQFMIENFNTSPSEKITFSSKIDNPIPSIPKIPSKINPFLQMPPMPEDLNKYNTNNIITKNVDGSKIPQLKDIKNPYTLEMEPQQDEKLLLNITKPIQITDDFNRNIPHELDLLYKAVDPSQYYKEFRPVKTFLEDPFIRGYNFSIYGTDTKDIKFGRVGAEGENLTGLETTGIISHNF